MSRKVKKSKLTFLIALVVLLILTPIVISFLQAPNPAEAGWVDDNFSYRNAIPITSHTAAENNVYVSATIDTSASGQFQADCGDLRFTTVGGDILPYYIVSGCVSASTVVHVFFKSMPAGAQALYYYYGNPSAANGFSSADFATVASSYALGSIASQEKGGAPIAYWKFDDATGTNAQDSSPNNNDGTITGATWQTEDQCISGKCLKFNGSTDVSTTTDPSNGSLDPGTDSFTYSTWVKTGSYGGLIQKQGTPYIRFYISAGDQTYNGVPAGHVQLRLWDGTYNAYFGGVNTANVADNKWHHVAAVLDKSAGTYGKIFMYVDGNLVNTLTLSQSLGSLSSSGDVLVGRTYNFISGGWNLTSLTGFLDDVKIYNYARTAAQIKSDFKSRGTAKGSSASLGSKISDLGSLSNGLVGYWKLDESATPSLDSSGNGNSGTWVGNTAATSGKFGNGISLDGTGDYLTAGSTSFPSGNTARTISLWTKRTGAPNAAHYIITYGTAADGQTFAIDAYTPASTKLRVVGYNNDWATNYTLPINEWHFITTTYDGINSLKLFVDGNLQDSTTAYTFNTVLSSNTIGGWFGNNYTYQGNLDEVRIYNRALSPREVRDLYNWAPGPVGYWNMDEKTGTTAYDSSGYGNNTTSWSGSPLWSLGKYGSGLSFNGANNLEITANSNFNVRALTIESWIKTPTSMGGTVYRALFSKQGADRDYNWYTYSSDGTKVTHLHFSSSRWTTGNPLIALPTAFDANTWHHVAVTVDASNIKFYADGVMFYSASSTDSYANNSYNIWIAKADNYWSGIMDDVRFYNYARNSKQIVEDMNAGHPVGGSPVGSQIAYYRFDEGYGTTTSNSGNGGATYNAALASSPNSPTWNNEGKYGKALNFDGSNDYATINTSLPTLTEGSISMWVKRTATTGTYQMIFTDSGSQFEMAWVNASTLTFYVNNVGINANAANLNIWYYITGTFSETGNYQRIYVNGILANSSTYPGDATTATRYFGSRAGSYPFAGSIDEVKIYSSALTEDEIKLDYNRGQAMVLGTLSDTSGLTGGSVASSSASAEYCIPGDTATCTPPVARWDFEEGSGNANDTSGNGNTGTPTGTTVVSGKVGKARSFNGTSDYVSVADSNTWTFNDFTIELWVNANSWTGNWWERAFVGHDEGGGNLNKWIFSYNTSTLFHINDTSDLGPTITGNSWTAQTNTWYHITLTRSGNVYTFYRNGNFDGSTTNSYVIPNAATPLTIGWGEGAGKLNGKIDGVKIYNYARTPAQIAWDYNRGGPVGHWRMDECQGATAKDSSGNNNTGTITIGATGTQTAVGTCTTSGTAWYNGVTGKFNSSLNFDGTDDYVDLGTNSIYQSNLASSQYTWSAWTKTTADNVTILTYGTTYNPRIEIYQNKIYWYFVSGEVSSDAGNLSDGNWHHVVITNNNLNIQFYIDGKSKGSGTSVSGTTGNQLNIGKKACGGCSDSYFNGQIDDVRIYNYALTASQVKNLFNGGAAVKFGPVTGSP